MTIIIIKHRRFQHIFLLGASYFFFYYTSNYLITLLIFTTIWDFYFGKMIFNAKTSKQKKICLIISLAGNLGLLGYFKYVDFAIVQFNIFGQYFDLGYNIPLLHLALPIAISFYTFHSITYTVSIYRNQIMPTKTLTEYAIFVAFFPQLVAGPILRAKEFLPQLRDKITAGKDSLKMIIIDNSNLKFGVTMMIFGFLKKMFFSDNISPFVNSIFENPIGADSFSIILATIGFGVQIYCDFSGYSDIAIGAALILGFRIPINFNKPYFASSPSDFWRRWHISLSSWLRDYLYIPLGGNKKSHLRTYVNLGTVMFLGGLWHGASWNFIIWGLLHGGYLVIHRFVKDKFPAISKIEFFESKIGKVISIIIMQYFVFLAWIPFRIHDFNYMIYSMQKYVFFDFEISGIGHLISINKFPIGLIGIFFILQIIVFLKPELLKRVSELELKKWTIFLITAMSMLILFYVGPEDFIYFKF